MYLVKVILDQSQCVIWLIDILRIGQVGLKELLKVNILAFFFLEFAAQAKLS
jgi:hypothetical protein